MFSVYSSGNRGMLLLLLGMAVAILVMGSMGGTTVYRTLFYLPNFTAGVATMLLWKKLFQPNDGVINILLQPPLGKTHAPGAGWRNRGRCGSACGWRCCWRF